MDVVIYVDEAETVFFALTKFAMMLLVLRTQQKFGCRCRTAVSGQQNLQNHGFESTNFHKTTIVFLI